MSHNVILIIALSLPVLLFLFLRVNAALVFLSACLGSVLVEHVGPDAITVFGSFSSKPNSLSATTIQLLLLLVPTVVTTVVMALSVHGKLRVFLNMLPAAAASMLLVLLLVPLLPRGLAFELMHQPTWRILSNSEALVMTLGAIVSLLFLWSQRRNFRHHDKRKH